MILLLFIFFTPAGNPPHFSSSSELHRLQEFIGTRRNETERLRNSTWLHPPANITWNLTIPGATVTMPVGSINKVFLPPEIIDAATDIWHKEILAYLRLSITTIR